MEMSLLQSQTAAGIQSFLASTNKMDAMALNYTIIA
jgi:hypothetical protein